jgi:hypothetical protein
MTALEEFGATSCAVNVAGDEHEYAGRFGNEATFDQQGVVRVPSPGKVPLLTPVDSTVI